MHESSACRAHVNAWIYGMVFTALLQTEHMQLALACLQVAWVLKLDTAEFRRYFWIA